MDVSEGKTQKLAAKRLLAHVSRMKSASFKGQAINFLMADLKSTIMTEDKKAQSSPDAPVVMCRDLSKTHGDEISIDVINPLTGLPIMGDGTREGFEEALTTGDFTLKINQYAKGVKMGGKMAQQRKGYSLVQVGKAELGDYWGKLYSEIMFYSMAGSRGSFRGRDQILPPVEPDPVLRPDLADIYVNGLQPPTFDRHFFGGDAKSIGGGDGGGMTALTTADTFDIETIRRVMTSIQEMDYPLGTISLQSKDKPTSTDPMLLCLCTPRQFEDARNDAGSQFQELQAQALRRAAGFNHPIFIGDSFMVDNILVKKYFAPVRFYPGDKVRCSRNDAQASVYEDTVPANVTVDRALVLGRQAVALAIGATVNGTEFNRHTEKYDGNSKTRSFLDWMGGIKKIRLPASTGELYDVGVIAIDTAIKNPPAI
jgi:N4-gp56 family major capsid protein